MNKRILTHLVLLTLIISCLKGKPHQIPHPDQGAVVVTADWSGKSSEADIPLKYVLRIADVKQEVSGYANNKHILSNRGNFDNYHAFKASKEYPAPAPATTTGWFLPSSGQCWDLLQYLGECPFLADPAEQTSDALGYYLRVDQGDVPAALNKWMVKIADKDKQAFASDDNIWTSTWAESSIHNWYIASEGYVFCRYLFTAVENGRMIVRPVLAF